MSTAPRPHTSPFTSSPPKGSRVQCSGVTGTTSVWPMRQRVGAAGSVPSMRATRLRRPGALVDLDVEPALAEVGTQEIAVAHLLARFHAAVVHARVADHVLQELHRLVGEGVVHGGRHHSIV